MSAPLEAERQQYEEQREIVLASLKDDPGNAELLNLKHELEEMMKLLDDSLAESKPQTEPADKTSQYAQDQPAKERRPRENQDGFKRTTAAVEEKDFETTAPTPAIYRVNDNVTAKWVSGDKGFYSARITSVTGSSTNPMYTVKFKSYDTVETLRAKDIRPATAAQKRKAAADAPSFHPPPAAGTHRAASDLPSSTAKPGLLSPSASPSRASRPTTTASTAPSAGASSSGVVRTAEASLYPQAQQASGQDAADGEDKPRKKFKKIKANKELEAGKNRWQEFNQKSRFGKAVKKESMFRTPEGVHGRVGFTGSGQAMRKDPTRARHVYQANEELD